MHRIIGGTPRGFVTRGDGNTWTDLDQPRAGDIIGRVVVHVPAGGRASALLRHPLVLGGLLLGFTLTFVARRNTGSAEET